MTPRYLLDTNICIFLKNNRHPNVARKLAGLQPGDVAMSVVTWGELVLGAEKSRERSQTLAKITKLRTLVPVLELSAAVGDRYGAIRAELKVPAAPSVRTTCGSPRTRKPWALLWSPTIPASLPASAA